MSARRFNHLEAASRRSLPCLGWLGGTVVATVALALTACQATVLTPLRYAGAESPEQAPPPATPAPIKASLPWPARQPLKPAEFDAKIIARLSTGQTWQPMGVIAPVESPLNAFRVREELPQRHRKAFDDAVDALKSQAQPPKAEAETFVLAMVPEGPGAFIFVKGAPDPDNPAGPLAGRASLLFQHLSAREPTSKMELVDFEDKTKNERMQLRVKVATSRIERTWFAYYDPFPPRDDKGFLDGDKKARVRGLVVVLPGMFGTPPDQISTLIRRLRNEGFAVLRMMAHPSLFTEHVSFAVPMEGPLDSAAEDIALELTGRTAEVAYALESALAHVMKQRPELVDAKLGLVGMSGGAMVTPTVIARNPKLFERVVMIGGGANYLQILLESNYREWIDAVEVLFYEGSPPKPTPNADGSVTASKPIKADEPAKLAADGRNPGFRLVTKGDKADARRKELLAAYQRAAPLDSANLATSLKDVKSLVIQGTTDRAVPRETGDLLWEKAGKPERILVPGGHEWLFFTLNRQMPRITEFLAQGLDPSGATLENTTAPKP
jgi:hypothetical protein